MNTGPGSLRHRPFLMPIWLTVIAACLAFFVVVFAAVAVWNLATSSSTIVIVMRHVEKGMGEDPAALLAGMFGGNTSANRIDAIYVSGTALSRATVAPLAAALNLTPIAASTDDPRTLAKRALGEHAGGRVLIVGDALTVPGIVAQLSGSRDIPAIRESEHGAMYIVTVPRVGHANWVRLNY